MSKPKIKSTHIFLDIETAVNPDSLTKEVFQEIVKTTGANILNCFEYQFTPQGKTINITLSESHATIHTYPEHNFIFTELMTCGDIDEKQFITGIIDFFKPVKSTLRIIDRSI